MKRFFDFVVAFLGLLVLALPLLILIIMIRRKLGSPVFFRQVRPGLGGAPFEMVKFRTMTDAKGSDEAHLLEEVTLEGGHHARAHRSC